MSYYKLPTKLKQGCVTAVIIITYGITFYYLSQEYSDIHEDTKRFLNQFGLMVIFVSGLLAGVGIFWFEKVKHNKELAEKEIEEANNNIAILTEQSKQLKIDLSGPIDTNKLKKLNAKEQLDEVENHPDFIRFSGHLSILTLAIGTMMCIIGAG